MLNKSIMIIGIIVGSFYINLGFAVDSDSILVIFESSGSSFVTGDFILNQTDSIQTGSFSISGDGLFQGNVGIGTSDPLCDLHIEATNPYMRFTPGTNQAGEIKFYEGPTAHFGSFDYTGSIFRIIANHNRDIQLKTSTGSIFMEGTNGNTGIGTIEPKEKLHLWGSDLFRLTGNPGAQIRFTRGYNSGEPQIPNDGEYNLAGIYAQAPGGVSWGGNLFFRTAPTTSYGAELEDRMVIRHNGNIGIGTNEPSENLEIEGKVKINSGVSSISLCQGVNTSVPYLTWAVDFDQLPGAVGSTQKVYLYWRNYNGACVGRFYVNTQAFTFGYCNGAATQTFGSKVISYNKPSGIREVKFAYNENPAPGDARLVRMVHIQ